MMSYRHVMKMTYQAKTIHQRESHMQAQFRYPVMIDGRRGYIDRDGTLVIPPRADREYAEDSSGSWAFCTFTDNTTGLLGSIDPFGSAGLLVVSVTPR
jgi:hypothetical protein